MNQTEKQLSYPYNLLKWVFRERLSFGGEIEDYKPLD